jgi:hypothetical protein
VMVSFLHEDQFVVNTNLNKWLSPRHRMPPNLIDLAISIPGREGLVAFEGIKNLGVAAGVNSESVKNYHRQLIQDGTFDGDFASFFPNNRNDNISYCQAILVPLLNYDVPEATQMKIVLKYNDGLSQPRWHLNCFCIVQRLLECNERHTWEWKDL